MSISWSDVGKGWALLMGLTILFEMFKYLLKNIKK